MTINENSLKFSPMGKYFTSVPGQFPLLNYIRNLKTHTKTATGEDTGSTVAQW